MHLTVPIEVKMDMDEIIERLKKDDFVRVVRCKDCVYLYRTAAIDMVDALADHVCTYWESDGLYLDDYCSQGKRIKP